MNADRGRPRVHGVTLYDKSLIRPLQIPGKVWYGRKPKEVLTVPDRFMELLNQIVVSDYGQEKAEQVLCEVRGELEAMVFVPTSDPFQKRLNEAFYPFIAAYHVLQNEGFDAVPMLYGILGKLH